jgi:CheY-like chemotaxis protein
VAHDFNNLLMAVLGSLELLRKRLPNDPALLRLVDNAAMGARRGATLTQRMLSFARRQELDTHPLDVAQLVRGMSDLLERTLGTEAELQLDFPPALGNVVADDNQLELAVLNLCVNARDAMKRGGHIVIAAREEEVDLRHESGLKPGHYVCLSVTDSGEGMDAQTLARASEPFFTTKGVGKGTGLGLSMVHGMAEQMGGRLVLHSTPDEGTTAEIWLPMVGEGPRPQSAAAAAPQSDPGPRKLKVLAVDDDRLVLFNTIAMLEDLGHEAVEAGSGEEALGFLRAQDFDLVITDQSMPKMTGAQLLEIIARERPGLPVILATGYAEFPEGVAAKTPRLGKPFTERDLARILTSVMAPKS